MCRGHDICRVMEKQDRDYFIDDCLRELKSFVVNWFDSSHQTVSPLGETMDWMSLHSFNSRWTAKVALRAFVSLPYDPASISSTYIVAQNY